MKFPFWRRHKEPDDTQRQLGNLIVAKKVTRRMRGSLWIEQFLSDSVFGLKALRKNPSCPTVQRVYAVFVWSIGNGSCCNRRRTQEIGIRISLGASKVTILRLILNGIMIRTVIGLAIGVAASLALTRLTTSLLFEVNATDFVTFVGVPASLTIVSLVACYLPARRASKVDPMVVLRYE